MEKTLFINMDTQNHRFHAWWEKLPNAFAYHQVLVDKKDKPLDYVFLYVNAAFEKMTGLKKDNIIGKKVTEVIPGIEKSKFDWIGTYGKVALDKKTVRFEQYSEPLNRWYDVTAFSDDPGHFATVFFDITQIKKTEKRLRQSEERNRSMIEALPDILIICDKEGRYLDVIAPLKEKLYQPKEEVLGKKISDVFSNKEAVKIMEAIKKSIKTKSLQMVEYHLEVPAGKLYFEARITPFEKDKVLALIRDITLRKKDETELMQYKTAVEQSMDGIALASLDGKILFVNKAWAKMHRRSVHELTGTHLSIFHNQEQLREEVRPFLEKLLASGFNKREVGHVRKDGATFPTLMAATIIKGEDGKPLAMLGIAFDITVQKETQKALKKAKDDYQAIVNLTGDIIVQVDKEGRWVFLNDQACAFWGASREELLGRSLAKYLHPDDLGETSAVIDRMVRHRKIEKGLLNRQNTPKGWRTVQWNGVPIFKDGKYVGFQATGRDITEIKATEKKLHESEKKHRRLFETMAQGVIYQDAQGKIISANPAAERMLGLTFKQMQTKTSDDPCWKSIAEDGSEVPGSDHPAMIALRTGKPVGPFVMGIFNPKIHEHVWLSINAIPLLGHGDKKPFQVYATFDDITEKKKAEQTLKEQLAFERLLSDISSRFINLSHDEADHAINIALKQTGSFFQVDRSYILQFSSDQKSMNNTHEWCADGIESQIDTIKHFSLENISWWAGQMKSLPYVYVPDIEKLPASAGSEKKEWARQSIQSLITIPIKVDGRLIACFGFDLVKRKRSWTEQEITLLKVLTDTISNALTKYKLEQKILYMGFHDSLTSLYNRSYMEQEMARLDSPRQLPISIIMADLNGLKLVNDTYGHSVGDKMLQKTAAILKEICRKEDIISRWGGDEFVILLPQTPQKQAASIARRILKNCEQVHIQDLPVSLALGFSHKESDKIELSEVLKQAENKMYDHKLTQSRSARSNIVNALLETLKEKSFETEQHIRKMQAFALVMGKSLSLSEAETDRLLLLVMLHDIGKVNIPKEILTKKGKLTPRQWGVIKEHPQTGYRIALAIPEFSHLAEDILCHHERWDGSGYPRGLKEKDIPLFARILAIADAYEVMTNGRVYKKALTKDQAIDELCNCAGNQFDPDLVEAFIPSIT